MMLYGKNWDYNKLSKKHKRKYLLHQFIVILLLIAAAITAWSVTDTKLPNTYTQFTAGFSFVLSVVFLVFAVKNRLSTLFKIRSFGMIMMFLIFLGIYLIIEVMLWMTGLLALVMLLDDIIMTRYWRNVWYDEYEQ